MVNAAGQPIYCDRLGRGTRHCRLPGPVVSNTGTSDVHVLEPTIWSRVVALLLMTERVEDCGTVNT